MKRHEIERFACDSTSIASMGYGDGVCVVQFSNGHLFAYAMSHAEWEKFRDAESKGKYYAAAVKGRFSGEKLTGKCGQCGSEPEVLGEPCGDCGADVVRQIDSVHKERD